MTGERLQMELMERSGRDPERIERYRRLIIFGKPAQAQAAIEAAAEVEARRDRYAREFSA